MTRRFFICLLLALIAAATACSKSSHVADGVDAKPTKIERATSFSIGSARATARAGHDLARVFFDLTASSNVKEVKLNSDQQELVDSEGKSYKSDADLTFTFGSGGGKMSMDAMFEVPTSATLKTFKLGNASFDVSSMEGAKPTAAH